MRGFRERARRIARAKAGSRCHPCDFEKLVEIEENRLIEAYRKEIGFEEPKGGPLARMSLTTLKVR